jgi:hypothetical protein
MAKASIAVKSEGSPPESVPNDDAVSIFFDTLAEIGMSDKEAAYTMAMDPGQLSRVKSHQARLPLDAIWRLPNRFWVVFRERLDDARGLNPAREKELFAQRIGELVSLLIKQAA